MGIYSEPPGPGPNLISLLGNVQGHAATINQDLRSLSDAQGAYSTQVSSGNQIQQQRLTFRQHAAALTQGYRTQDAAFLLFQNEDLQRYKTLFNLAAQYADLAANAYDYETGLLNTEQGQALLNEIVSSQALGVVQAWRTQFAGTGPGDPGLPSALAEMYADWSVLKGRASTTPTATAPSSRCARRITAFFPPATATTIGRMCSSRAPARTSWPLGR